MERKLKTIWIHVLPRNIYLAQGSKSLNGPTFSASPASPNYNVSVWRDAYPITIPRTYLFFYFMNTISVWAWIPVNRLGPCGAIFRLGTRLRFSKYQVANAPCNCRYPSAVVESSNALQNREKVLLSRLRFWSRFGHGFGPSY